MANIAIVIMDNNDGYRTPTARDVQRIIHILKRSPNAYLFFKPFNRILYDLLMSGY